ncbi:MAG: hypothetical protein NZZ41_02145 [Candidatus Dojkabacteria bacterium]|nr:hypothetical protein [Candidatus Dojkabacteria bacterium]
MDEIERIRVLSGITPKEETINKIASVPVFDIAIRDLESQIRPDLNAEKENEPEIDTEKFLDTIENVIEEEVDFFVHSVTSLNEVEKNLSKLNEDQLKALQHQIKKLYKEVKNCLENA